VVVAFQRRRFLSPPFAQLGVLMKAMNAKYFLPFGSHVPMELF
jgi:hypothetical protein